MVSQIRRRQFPDQNILSHLRRRELHISRPGAELVDARRLHTSFYPNYTVVNVEKPNCFLRKFSPDGSTLVAFSAQQAAVEIYEFRGADAAGQMLAEKTNGSPVHAGPSDDACQYSAWGDDTVDLESEGDWCLVRQRLFAKFFRLRHTVMVSHGNEQLNRECSLFTPDGRYLIVAASALVHEDHLPRMNDVMRNNESLAPNPNMLPEDYWIYIVDTKSGQVVDTKWFKCDRIYLAHNQGVCLYDRTLSVLSVQHQTIHLFRIDEDGHFIELQSIGPFLYDDDEMLVNSASDWTQRDWGSNNPRVPPGADPLFSGLKQRILAFMYRKAIETEPVASRQFAVRNFYRFFEFYRQLRMWRMQLLDESHLLIRYASEDVVSLRVDASTQSSFFVFYDIREARVLAVFEGIAEELLRLYECYYDDFRGWPSDRFISTLSNSLEARRSHDRFKSTILNAKFGGQTEAIRRVLFQLPISAQSFNPSPYLDLELFSYDDKWVSVYERPRPCSEYPIRFHGRKCGTMKFQLLCGPNNRTAAAHSVQRSLVAFIFHPYEPFVISLHRNNRDYIVNFHLRFESPRSVH